MLIRLAGGLCCFAGVAWGFSAGNWFIGVGAAVMGLCFLAVSTAPTVDPVAAPSRSSVNRYTVGRSPSSMHSKRSLDESSTDKLVAEMLLQGRYTLLLRAGVIDSLSNVQRGAALRMLNESMSLTPAGRVMVSTASLEASETATTLLPIDLDATFIDRFPVTNREFEQFVANGGYEQPSLWSEDIQSMIGQFVDRSGHPGPRYWWNGIFPDGDDDYPVVGVSWYEAAAYARWVGKRLPSDPEWVKAASWPLESPDGRSFQKKYPWGDNFEASRSNVWAAGIHRTVSVHKFGAGGSAGGVYDLIGNVWEWLHSEFDAWDDPRDKLATDEPMKSLRGGAFDTYFENQATCNFQSGDNSLARKRNIGFRCAIAASDLMVTPEHDSASTPESTDSHE